ncbi:MAG TPA: preprotein translocase subunit SecA [Nitrospinota bacterium]|jgi:preprotein translocase subunit SecA|nr:preprotein translocase subunit SecA [Nitrospinota bacterium]
MVVSFLKKIVGTKNDRELKRLDNYVREINALEPDTQKLSDDELKNKTQEFKNRLNQGESLEDILPETFAVVREVGKRTLNMRHFDVQLIGGVVLHEGKIAEMKTGEGKTLVATLPIYLNALTGKGVHLITVNDYLARRDSEWMGAIYKFLGMSVGVIQHDMNDKERQEAYQSDITYGTNNEFGFDYLRDNMKFDSAEFVQKHLNYAIVDEVDSILVDEARTPLIISGPSEESTDKYYKINQIIPPLKKGSDFDIEEKTRSVSLTEGGVAKAEKLLNLNNLYDPKNIEILHHVNQGLKAHAIFKRDVDYVVKEGEVLIVDEFTGRMMPGRRYSDGLHQALEAKENVKIESENQTLATITFQNYFRMYEKLAGMTGTADTEAAEFHSIYKLEVIVVPTDKKMIRDDCSDVIYRTTKEKFNAIVDEIVELNKKGQPMLVGTISIENSEKISHMLKRRGVKHHVLNAKHHEKEAEIVSAAGKKSSVTIATNMAGRGTDIVLEDGVPDLGGLHILGSERHESRRIDNQLRGRSGRQGDHGSSRFYISMEDDLMRIFGSDRISGIMQKLGMEEGVPIEHKLISRAIENAQKKVEGHNFDIRKHLLEYDDVMNKQREVIYEQRREVLEGKNLKERIFEMIEDLFEDSYNTFIDPEAYPEDWDVEGLKEWTSSLFSVNMFLNGKNLLKINNQQEVEIAELTCEDLKERLLKTIKETYELREKQMGDEKIRWLEKRIMLYVIDTIWKDHLLSMDHLKEGIGLRGYAQKNPLNEYKKEGYEMFVGMIERIKQGIMEYLFRVQVATEEEQEIGFMPQQQQKMLENHGGPPESRGGGGVQTTVKRNTEKVGRNQPCPCGSGKKYKKCCGA